jgi:3'-phosphoadenosine 5'-phosphosulfate sulfotransferase (PAPS reductase)/FAD synthetase
VNTYTKEDLKIMQSWDLQKKIQVTQTRIIEWYQRFNGKVHVNFSGGKDSTVLLDLARRIYPDIEAVYVDTGLEFPEIRQFVKTKENVTILRPKMRFDEVIKKYGWNFPSKEVALAVYYARKGSQWAINVFKGLKQWDTIISLSKTSIIAKKED